MTRTRWSTADALARGARPTNPTQGVGVLAKPSPARTSTPRGPSELEALLDQHIAAAGLPEPEHEYRFHETRRWRFDRAWADRMLAVEVEGVTYGEGGRHQRPAGMAADCVKYNTATLAGWRVLRFTGAQVRDGTAIDTLCRAIHIDTEDAS